MASAYFANDNWSQVEKLEFNLTQLTDRYLKVALLYLFRKTTGEVKRFNGKEVVKKLGVEKGGVLLSQHRQYDGLNFSESVELDFIKLGNLGLKLHIPVLDRHSPLSYAIAQHIHWVLGKHRGVETMNRMSIEHVKIIKGATLYMELSQECTVCKKRRRKQAEAEVMPSSNLVKVEVGLII